MRRKPKTSGKNSPAAIWLKKAKPKLGNRSAGNAARTYLAERKQNERSGRRKLYSKGTGRTSQTKICRLRKAAGWSYQELAARSGLSPETLKALEEGQKPMTPYHLRKILDAYKYFQEQPL